MTIKCYICITNCHATQGTIWNFIFRISKQRKKMNNWNKETSIDMHDVLINRYAKHNIPLLMTKIIYKSVLMRDQKVKTGIAYNQECKWKQDGYNENGKSPTHETMNESKYRNPWMIVIAKCWIALTSPYQKKIGSTRDIMWIVAWIMSRSSIS